MFPIPATKGCEGPDYRDKAGNDDCLAAVFFVKFMRPVEVFPVEKPHVLIMKNLRPYQFPYPVIDRVAQYGSHGEHK